ncbi:hypothetical protein PSPO01_00605 [Paraphaeosphaeria sporulosa]
MRGRSPREDFSLLPDPSESRRRRRYALQKIPALAATIIEEQHPYRGYNSANLLRAHTEHSLSWTEAGDHHPGATTLSRPIQPYDLPPPDCADFAASYLATGVAPGAMAAGNVRMNRAQEFLSPNVNRPHQPGMRFRPTTHEVYRATPDQGRQSAGAPGDVHRPSNVPSNSNYPTTYPGHWSETHVMAPGITVANPQFHSVVNHYPASHTSQEQILYAGPAAHSQGTGFETYPQTNYVYPSRPELRPDLWNYRYSVGPSAGYSDQTVHAVQSGNGGYYNAIPPVVHGQAVDGHDADASSATGGNVSAFDGLSPTSLFQDSAYGGQSSTDQSTCGSASPYHTPIDFDPKGPVSAPATQHGFVSREDMNG